MSICEQTLSQQMRQIARAEVRAARAHGIYANRWTDPKKPKPGVKDCNKQITEDLLNFIAQSKDPQSRGAIARAMGISEHRTRTVVYQLEVQDRIKQLPRENVRHARKWVAT